MINILSNTYPEKLRLNNENADNQHFHQQAKCYNCNKYFGWIKVPKGVIVTEWEKLLTCDNCEVTGKMGVW